MSVRILHKARPPRHNLPQCSAPVEFYGHPLKIYAKRRAKRCKENGDDPKCCSKRATVEIDGKAYCNQHGGPVAIGKLMALCQIVEKQAKMDDVWFVAETITEDMVQKQLRLLHEVIEGKTSAGCAWDFLNGLTP